MKRIENCSNAISKKSKSRNSAKREITQKRGEGDTVFSFLMATRSRTLLFLQYRNSYARAQSSAPHFSAGASETEGLIESSDHVIEMSVLPPQW